MASELVLLTIALKLTAWAKPEALCQSKLSFIKGKLMLFQNNKSTVHLHSQSEAHAYLLTHKHI